MLIVSVNKFGAEAVQQHQNAIQAAKDAGVKRLLYTSHQGANPSSAFAPCRDHAATEALLQSSGVPYVALRNGFYAESALFQLGGIKQSGEIALPEDGPVSWTARVDLSVAAVAALTEPGLFDGTSPPLSNSRSLDFADIARIASEVLGRTIVRRTTTDQEYRMGLVARGLPEVMAEGLAGLYSASRAGEFAVIDPTLEHVLGHSPVTIKDVLSGYLAAQENNAR